MQPILSPFVNKEVFSGEKWASFAHFAYSLHSLSKSGKRQFIVEATIL
jgi:hypothetical protein